MIYGLKPGARALLPGPLYHSAPNSFGLRAGRLGGALVLMPRFDPEEFLRVIDTEKIDTIFMVPTMFIRLMKLPEEVRKKYDMSSLRHIIHAAAPCPADVKRAMIEWWGPVIYEFYGSTESGAVTFATSEDALKRPGTVGKISPGAELRFIGDDGKEVPQGEIGEIYSRIAGNPDFTYHNKSEKRAEIDRDGFITSGDVGYIDTDGYVFICDRKRDMVISGGVNIYPAEIEAVLHAVPGVHDCAVFGIPDAEFGEALMAVVEPQPGVTLDMAAVRAQLKAALADYKVPKHIEVQSTCRGRIPGRSSSAGCAIPIGSGRGGGFSGRKLDCRPGDFARDPIPCYGASAPPLCRPIARISGRFDECRCVLPPPASSCAAAKSLHTWDKSRAASGAGQPCLPASCLPRPCLPKPKSVPSVARK